MTVKVKLGLHRIKTSDLIAKSLHVESQMTGNALYSNPTPAIPAITAERKKLETLAAEAVYGDRRAIALRRDQEEVLRDMLRTLGAYVKMTARTTSDVLSSGFDVYKASEPTTSIGRPTNLEAKRTNTSGTIKLNWKAVRGSQHYLVEMATTLSENENENVNWALAAYSSRSKLEINALTPGAWYWFRVSALGSKGKSGYSDPASVMAA